MGETILFIVLIIVMFLITVTSIYALVKLRKKAGANDESLDASFDICISELNKMGSLIKSEIEAKYKEILFLYDLMEQRHKQIEELISKNKTVEKFEDVVIQVDKVDSVYEELSGILQYSEPSHKMDNHKQVGSYDDYIRSLSPNHRIILEMSEQGKQVSEIAKELGIGQGEVNLIINIAKK